MNLLSLVVTLLQKDSQALESNCFSVKGSLKDI